MRRLYKKLGTIVMCLAMVMTIMYNPINVHAASAGITITNKTSEILFSDIDQYTVSATLDANQLKANLIALAGISAVDDDGVTPLTVNLNYGTGFGTFGADLQAAGSTGLTVDIVARTTSAVKLEDTVTFTYKEPDGPVITANDTTQLSSVDFDTYDTTKSTVDQVKDAIISLVSASAISSADGFSVPVEVKSDVTQLLTDLKSSGKATIELSATDALISKTSTKDIEITVVFSGKPVINATNITILQSGLSSYDSSLGYDSLKAKVTSATAATAKSADGLRDLIVEYDKTQLLGLADSLIKDGEVDLKVLANDTAANETTETTIKISLKYEGDPIITCNSVAKLEQKDLDKYDIYETSEADVKKALISLFKASATAHDKVRTLSISFDTSELANLADTLLDKEKMTLNLVVRDDKAGTETKKSVQLAMDKINPSNPSITASDVTIKEVDLDKYNVSKESLSKVKSALTSILKATAKDYLGNSLDIVYDDSQVNELASKLLSDGKYTLKLTATDKNDNKLTATKEVTITLTYKEVGPPVITTSTAVTISSADLSKYDYSEQTLETIKSNLTSLLKASAKNFDKDKDVTIQYNDEQIKELASKLFEDKSYTITLTAVDPDKSELTSTKDVKITLNTSSGGTSNLVPQTSDTTTTGVAVTSITTIGAALIALLKRKGILG